MALHNVGSKRRTLEESKDEQQNYGQLFPGIPNEISVDFIVAKFLSWKDICNLSSVSRGWHHAVRSREVHRARVRLESTETLIVEEEVPRELRSLFLGELHTPFFRSMIDNGELHNLFLRSMRDNSCYRLPPMLGPGYKSVPLDGRIFIMGGLAKIDNGCCSNEMYVLDLAAGRKQWKRCANMKEARSNFACSVLDGKIYVFGGARLEGMFPRAVCGSEVYDPKEDTWKSIKASRSLRFLQQVVPIGPELVLHGGHRFVSGIMFLIVHDPFSLEVYHPDKNDWRVPNESTDNWARPSTTWEELSNFREVAADGTTIMARLPQLLV